MNINITNTKDFFQFENKEALRNTAKEILSKEGASDEKINNILDKSVFLSQNTLKELYPDAQLLILRNSIQMSLNNPLKGTANYLKKHQNKNNKKDSAIGKLLGLVYHIDDSDSYSGEYIDFEIDKTAENIFSAA